MSGTTVVAPDAQELAGNVAQLHTRNVLPSVPLGDMLDICAWIWQLEINRRRCEHSRIPPLCDQVAVSLTHNGRRKPQQSSWVRMFGNTWGFLRRLICGVQDSASRRAGNKDRFSKLPASYLTVHMSDVQPASRDDSFRHRSHPCLAVQPQYFSAESGVSGGWPGCSLTRHVLLFA